MPDLSKYHPGLPSNSNLSQAGALTSAASVGVPTKVEFDKVVADLATLRTSLNALLAAFGA
jgi:hypothetical protein